MGTKIKCLICNDIIESKSRHDFVWCSCGNVAVDGGEDYLKVTFYTDKYEVIKEEDEAPSTI